MKLNSDRRFLSVVLIPASLQVLVFLVIPIFGTFLISFMDYTPLRDTNFFTGLRNYVEMFQDQNFWIAMRNTMVFTFGAVALNIVISLATATLICQLKSNKTRSFFRMMSFLPCMAPMVASSVVWQRTILSTQGGFLNKIITALGGEAVAWLGDARYIMISVIIFTLWADVGYNIILFTAGIDGIPDYLYEAAGLDGAGRWMKFRHVTLPLLGRTTAFVVLMTLNSYFQMFAQFEVLVRQGGPKNSGLVMTSYIYKMAFVQKQMGYAAAISMALFLVIAVVYVIQRKLSKVDWEY